MTRGGKPDGKARSLGAFFVCAVCILGLGADCAAGPARESALCRADRIDDRKTVAHVYDGDTVGLQGGERVRLIGIDTPEIGHDGKPSQPFAKQARAALRELVPPGTGLRLRYDREGTDKYGRVLAHLFLVDGTNLQARLLERGLATALAVPPNLAFTDCYVRAEERARRSGGGIWSLDRYRPVPSRNLDADTRGFRIVTGQVRRVAQGRENTWINLAGSVSLRIPQEDRKYFRGVLSEQIKGRRVMVRGWVHPDGREGQLRITVRHPAALAVLD